MGGGGLHALGNPPAAARPLPRDPRPGLGCGCCAFPATPTVGGFWRGHLQTGQSAPAHSTPCTEALLLAGWSCPRGQAHVLLPTLSAAGTAEPQVAPPGATGARPIPWHSPAPWHTSMPQCFPLTLQAVREPIAWVGCQQPLQLMQSRRLQWVPGAMRVHTVPPAGHQRARSSPPRCCGAATFGVGRSWWLSGAEGTRYQFPLNLSRARPGFKARAPVPQSGAASQPQTHSWPSHAPLSLAAEGKGCLRSFAAAGRKCRKGCACLLLAAEA